MPEQLLSWTDPTQLKVFDNRVARTVEEDNASMLSRAIELVKLSEESSFQRTQNRALWKQNRAACKQRLAAKRALLPDSQIPSAAVKVYPEKNMRGGKQTAKVCSICGQTRKGTHGKRLTDCPNRP